MLRGVDKKDSYSREAKPGEGATPWVVSRFRFGVPSEESLEFFGDDQARASYEKAIVALSNMGAESRFALITRYSDLLQVCCTTAPGWRSGWRR